MTSSRRLLVHRLVGLGLTGLVFALVVHRMGLARLWATFEGADYARFLAAMIPNTIFYFLWDTLVLATALRRFHRPVPYRDLLPVRAASYVVAFFNTNLGRGALAAYLSRRFRISLLQLGGTVAFLVLTEYLHLVGWAAGGLLFVEPEVRRDLWWALPAVGLVWLAVFLYSRLDITPRRAVKWLVAPREWALFRTFRLATLARYGEIVALRAPMFFVSLWLHYLAAPAFGLHIPFAAMVAVLPLIFMLAALPISIAHLGTTQAAWVVLFGRYGSASALLAFSLAAHLTFTFSRALLGLAFLPWAYGDLVAARPVAASGASRTTPA